jgi:hypothetical protein
MPDVSKNTPVDLKAKMTVPKAADAKGLRTVTASPYLPLDIDTEAMSEGQRGSLLARVDNIRFDESKKTDGQMFFVIEGTLLGGDVGPVRTRRGKGENASLTPVEVGDQITLSYVSNKNLDNFSMYGGGDLVANAESLVDVEIELREVTDNGMTMMKGFPKDGRPWSEIIRALYAGEIENAVGRIVALEYSAYRAGEKSKYKGQIRSRSGLVLAPIKDVAEVYGVLVKAGKVPADAAKAYNEELPAKDPANEAARRSMLDALAKVKREPLVKAVRDAIAAMAAPQDDAEPQ